MKKILIASAVALACIGAAKADYLYWQASKDQYNAVDIDNLSNAYSTLSYGHDDTGYTRLGTAPYTSSVTVGQYDMSSSPLIDFANGDANGKYNFIIELMTYEGGQYVSKGSVGDFTYEQLASASDLASLMANLGQFQATWSGATATKSVPEPTSGLMMLVGMALLGLKRRRV